MIRWKNYKYIICSYGTPNEQLFNLSTDPGENINLAVDPQYNIVKKEMASWLQQWMEKTRDR
jgi:hypothetical protein